MGSVLSYSGISTKIRAMSSHLVTDEQLQEIVRFSDVPQVVSYLKKTPEYASKWSDLDENNLHRGEIEKLLKKSIFGNFSRIYNFANKEQRKFLALYSKRYEIRVLKEILTNLFDHRSTNPVDMSPYRDFFLHHSKLDIDRVAGAGNMDEFMTALKGNEFYAPLQSVYENGNGLLFDYGMALDLYYFNQIWGVRKKLFKGNDLDEEHIAWLKRYLQDYENAFILISHDIPFLNDVINIVYHMENQELNRYVGDYDHFQEVYEVKKAQLEAAYRRQQQEISELKDFVARNKARVSTRNMAMSRQKKLDKMDVIELAAEKPKPEFHFKQGRTPGKNIFEIKSLVIGYEEPLSRPLTLSMERGQKIALVGANGIGKTTLLKSILGLIPALKGTRELGDNLQIGYFEQEVKGDNKTTCIDEI